VESKNASSFIFQYACARRAHIRARAFIEGIGDCISLFVFEAKLRREFRRSFGKGPETIGRGPKLREATRLRRDSIIRNDALNCASEDLNKKLAHAKRRDLIIVSSE